MNKLMGGNTTGEIEIGSERGLYKYIINHQTGTTKASTGMILVPMYNIFRLVIGVPDYSSSESYREKRQVESHELFSEHVENDGHLNKQL